MIQYLKNQVSLILHGGNSPEQCTNGKICDAKCQPPLHVSCQEVEFGVRSHLENIIVPEVLGAL